MEDINMTKNQIKEHLDFMREEALKNAKNEYDNAVHSTVIKQLEDSGFMEIAKDIVNVSEKILDWKDKHGEKLGYGRANWDTLGSIVNYVGTYENFIKRIVKDVSIDDNTKLAKTVSKTQETARKINENYFNVIENVKKCKNAKEATKYVKSLRFDIPDEVTECTDVMVPVDTRYLIVK